MLFWAVLICCVVIGSLEARSYSRFRVCQVLGPVDPEAERTS